MKEKLQTFGARFSLGIVISCGLSLIFVIGVSASLVALSELPGEETMRANTMQQRLIVDAKTGQVSGLGGKASAAFDVGDAAPEMPEHDTAQTTEASTETADGSSALRDTPEVKEFPAVARGPESLVKAPAPEAVETVGEWALPKRTAAGLAPSRLYNRGFTRTEGQRVLAIVITDVGFSNDTLVQILKLPKEVTLAVSPYAADVAKQIETLRNAGHETWVMLPAMTDAYPREDPGPLGILNSQPADALLARVREVMALSPGAAGMLLPPTEAISSYPESWNIALTEIDARGLYLLSTRSERSLDQLTKDKKKQESIRRADMILDSTPATAFIRSKLSTLASQFAAGSGDMIVIASARPQTLGILSDWLGAQREFTLAPLSATYRAYEAPPAPVEAKKKSGH